MRVSKLIYYFFSDQKIKRKERYHRENIFKSKTTIQTYKKMIEILVIDKL